MIVREQLRGGQSGVNELAPLAQLFSPQSLHWIKP
jgi:hypothetical protein